MIVWTLAAVAASAQVPSIPPDTTLIFFDWGKSEITGDARSALDAVAATYRQNPVARIRLAGHSDRSGPAGVNLRSSRRRAEAVRSYLVSRGVAAGAISVTAHGEQQPIVPTQDGVREAQNRRVEVRLLMSSDQ